MKILGISGSPRKGGNTDFLLQKLLERTKELGANIELIRLAEKNIAPCDGCEVCEITESCKIGDDMQQLYPKLLEADGIVIGTPVYFWNMTAQVKIFIDRTFLFRKNRPLRNKVSGFVLVGRRRGLSETMATLLEYCFIQRMVVAGGVTAHADKPGEAAQNALAIEETKELAEDMIRMIKQLRK